MKKTLLFLPLLLFFVIPASLQAAGYIEVTASGNRQLKLALDYPYTSDAASNSAVAKEMGDVIAFDMNMSGNVVAETRDKSPLAGGVALTAMDFLPWAAGGFDLLVRSEYSIKGDELTVEFRLFDIQSRKMMAARRFIGKLKELRRFSHMFADEILLSLSGEKGCFTSRIAFVSTQSGNKEIAIMDWDGHSPLRITSNGSINLNPDFSPDGREILFSSYKQGNPDLYRRALASPVETVLSNRKGLNITGAWSPDGSKIALSLSKDGNSEIYTLSKSGGNPVRLTVSPAIEISPSWSPDGKQMVFVSDRLGKPQLFIMAADGANVRRLTLSGGYNVNPRWSPRGDKIAYARMQGGGFQIYSINPDGSGDTQLTSIGSSENPSWSPDGRFITFSSKRGGVEAIYVMRADGSAQTRVSQNKGNSTQPAWSPRY